MLAGTLKDGFGITVAFAGHDFTLTMDPSSITPPGADGGDAIDTSTHSNTKYRTKHPKSLVEITDASFTAAYDPAVWDDIISAINDNVAITFTFPQAKGNLVVYGYLKSFTPNELVEGEQPTAECVIVITNENGSGVETAPVFT